MLCHSFRDAVSAATHLTSPRIKCLSTLLYIVRDHAAVVLCNERARSRFHGQQQFGTAPFPAEMEQAANSAVEASSFVPSFLRRLRA